MTIDEKIQKLIEKYFIIESSSNGKYCSYRFNNSIRLGVYDNGSYRFVEGINSWDELISIIKKDQKFFDELQFEEEKKNEEEIKSCDFCIYKDDAGYICDTCKGYNNWNYGLEEKEDYIKCKNCGKNIIKMKNDPDKLQVLCQECLEKNKQKEDQKESLLKENEGLKKALDGITSLSNKIDIETITKFKKRIENIENIIKNIGK